MERQGRGGGARRPIYGNDGFVGPMDDYSYGGHGGGRGGRGRGPALQQGLGSIPIQAPEGPPHQYSHLKARVKQLREAYRNLEVDYNRYRAQSVQQVQDYQARAKRAEDAHRLEIARLRKEIDYHKKLREAAERRAVELGVRYESTVRQAMNFDEAQAGLIQESQALHAKNSELTYKYGQAVNELQMKDNAILELREMLDALAADKEILQQEYDRIVNYGKPMPQMSDALESLADDDYEGGQESDGTGRSMTPAPDDLSGLDEAVMSPTGTPADVPEQGAPSLPDGLQEQNA